VMAGIAVLDELVEAERRIALLQQDVANLTEAGEALTREAEELERNFAKRLADAARKVEAVATAIDETGAANGGGER
jgi:cell division protein ZapA